MKKIQLMNQDAAAHVCGITQQAVRRAVREGLVSRYRLVFGDREEIVLLSADELRRYWLSRDAARLEEADMAVRLARLEEMPVVVKTPLGEFEILDAAFAYRPRAGDDDE